MQQSIVVPACTARFSWRRSTEYGYFEPNGRLTITRGGTAALRPNPKRWGGTSPIYAARLFVGFNVDDRPRWEMDDVVAIVRRMREQQVGNPSSTFLYQRGIYAHQKAAGAERLVADEEGAQIIILNLPELGVSVRDFRAQMIELAEAIAEQLEQEEVIVEIQRGGISKETMGVGPVQEEAT